MFVDGIVQGIRKRNVLTHSQVVHILSFGSFAKALLQGEQSQTVDFELIRTDQWRLLTP